MTDIIFMQHPYSIDTLVTHYLEEIKKLRVEVKAPIDETKLQTYYQAANAFKNVTTLELAQFVLSLGSSPGSKGAQMREALPILVGYRVTQPTAVDLAYAKLFLIYAQAFKTYKGNIKEWMVRFIVSSRFSPLVSLIDREIDRVIETTKSNIVAYAARL